MGPGGAFFDLPDYLTMRATGNLSRSLCSLVCKWTYLGHEQRWDDSYFRQIGLAELADESYRRIGQRVLPLGTPVGSGLSAQAAEALGLPSATPVGTSAIDAHAGGIGVIGASLEGETGPNRRLALVGGTSSCHMAVSAEPRFTPGVWGPLFFGHDAGPLAERGRSIRDRRPDRPSGANTCRLPGPRRPGAGAWLSSHHSPCGAPGCASRRVGKPRGPNGRPACRTRLPRQPITSADPTLRGMLSGLTLSASPDDLARLYLATVQAIAYGTREIIQTLNAQGYAIDTILACGGGTKDRVFLREHADGTGCSIVLPREDDAVLLGAAILGAVASAAFSDLPAAMSVMSRAATSSIPQRTPPFGRSMMRSMPYMAACTKTSWPTRRDGATGNSAVRFERKTPPLG